MTIPAQLAMFKTATDIFRHNGRMTDISTVKETANKLNTKYSGLELSTETKEELASISDDKEKLQNQFEFLANYNFSGVLQDRINTNRQEMKRAIDVEAETKLEQAAKHVPVIAEAQDKLRKIAKVLAAPVAA